MRILHAIHDFLPRHQAGAEIYAAELCRALADRRHHVTVLCADFDPVRPHGQLTWRVEQDLPVVELVNNWQCESFADTYQSARVTEQIRHVLQAVQPHVVHIHSLQNLSLDLPECAQACGIPVVATLHDFSLVCPSGGQRIHRAENHQCDSIDPERCARCFRQSPYHAQMSYSALAGGSPTLGRLTRRARQWFPQLGAWGASAAERMTLISVSESEISARLARVREVFQQIDLFVAPSAFVASEFRRLGVDETRLCVSSYGFSALTRRERQPPRRPLRLGFVGTLVWHKGVHVLLDAVRGLPSDAYHLRIFGDPGVFPDYSASLRRQSAGLPVTFMGTFDRTQVAEAYAAIDVLVVPSVWLENSPLVIHEAFMAGVPVVGARIGGIVDLVTDEVNGLLYDPKSADELSGILMDLVEHPERLNQLATKLPRVKSIADDAQEWEERYANVLSSGGQAT